jgi:hypothetical protein
MSHRSDWGAEVYPLTVLLGKVELLPGQAVRG